MGGQFSYAHCPQSPTEMPKELSAPKSKFRVCAAACGFVVAIVIVVLSIFLVLNMKERAECESQLRNHTSSAEGRTKGSDVLRAQLTAVNQSLAKTTKHWASCREELKHWRENTTVLEDNIRKKEVLIQQLEAVNQSLANSKMHWDSCQEELKHWRQNTTVLEDHTRKKEVLIQQLEGEKTRVQNQLNDLKKNIQDTCKLERDKKDEEIQRLKTQLRKQTSSGVVLFESPIASFLLLLLPGLVCSLL